jgi:uncharacterized membrane protein (DUF373 family)
MSNSASKSERLLRWFEIVIIAALQVLLVILIVVATITLYALFIRGLRENIGEIGTAEDLHGILQRGIGGVLIVLLGLELMETLKIYFSEHHIRVEVILVVAIIAVGRHIIKLDFEHVSASLLLGLSALITALAGGYFLVRWSNAPSKES